MNNKCLYCLAFLLLFTKLLYGQPDNGIMIGYWHKTLARQLGVSPQSFKLSQGSVTVLRSSNWMWSIFDTITADTSAYYYNPDQHNSFSDYYGSLLSRAKPIPFAIPVLADSCQLNTAILRYIAANNQYAWDKTIDQLFAKIPLSHGLHFIADTIMQTITDQLLKPLSINNLLGLTITRVNVSISCDFGRALIFNSSPYAIANPNNFALNNYSPWFTPCVYKNLVVQGLVAQAVRNPLEISSTKPVFKACIALVIADSINVSLKLQSVSKTILLQIAHYFPVNPDGAITSKVVNKGIIYTLTANTSSPAGNPILIGVLLMPVNLLYSR
ncbi:MULTISPECIES: hypothetical protein [unclassified Mucilaginibacter]|uniref:hypothetical protein n=1 Tax=unclassified Mucilaginibacter TaxID=2617802 RepID=UPI002AC8ABE7|nr:MULTISPECIES: hypothetical protein [unclassified Mucilaginibacter]MEB0260572.1 hypothetical protein [Mucilaginibacter sp. 10I4]MEB0278072.1 hypothetical protein [Mucilaginibacter sp. 10B2]MEB0302417.1 hypothetical protein [Mucilaginibacter sp. 5C4]WPX22983.1 hypothetical protein RHM67_17015 [Mucilaginibacter sp. 5C4]